MKKKTIVLDFLKFSVPNKIAFGRTVLSQMSVLPLFANPDVAYATATDIVNKLEGYYVASRGGAHEQVALMNKAEVEFDDIFRKLANNVDRVADGDEAVILSAGFHLAKQPAPTERPEFTVTAGDGPGTINLRRKAVAGAYSYVWQYVVGAEVPTDDKWTLAGSTTQANFEVTGLTSATKVWFRVSAVTKEGMQPFTDAIMKVVP
jgi:hypothetical protein